MARKRWTAQTEITDSLLRVREKRKWQLGYRRYIMESAPSEAYAPYFGLDAESLRKWFEIQFTEEMSWDTYAKNWQFDHIIPATYFDYANEEDLKLCWSFINMRVGPLDPDKNRGNNTDLLAVRPYFQNLYDKTGLSICLKMLEKIRSIEASPLDHPAAIENFILENKQRLESISTLTHEEFNQLNQGVTLEQVLLEKEILRKFGAAQ